MIAGGAEAVSDSPPTAEAVRRFGSIRLMWDGSNEMAPWIKAANNNNATTRRQVEDNEAQNVGGAITDDSPSSTAEVRRLWSDGFVTSYVKQRK